ncbi:MFS transporter, partial [Lysinibacillus telephonicus]
MIKNKQFFTLFFSQSISNIGEQIYILALPWFVYELTHSTLTMGTVAAMISLPQILFGFFLG